MDGNAKKRIWKRALAVLAGVIIVAGIGYGTYYSYAQHQKLQATERELAERTAAFEKRNKEMEEKVAEVNQENESITASLTDEQKKNLALEREKRKHEREINTLTKLTTIDPELLKKYSKVYFLSENYVPPGLENVELQYLVDPAKPARVLDQIAPFLDRMLAAAERDGVQLRVLSAYRSFTEQKALKSGYVVRYGTGANSFSAEQGYSEHQLGTAVDFTTPTVRGAYLSFENTTAFVWLKEKAYNYGFVLSYPKGNTYYTYEPWHWRFVGVDLADRLDDQEKYFYELDQRELDDYLISIFD